MSIVAKDTLTLTIEDAEATIRSAAQLYFSRQRARWLATHGAEMAQRVTQEIVENGAAAIGVQEVVRMIEAADDGCA